MIKNKDDLMYYLEQDRKALNIKRKNPKFFGDEIWKFEILLRKNEYFNNCHKNIFFLPLKLYYKNVKYTRYLCNKTGIAGNFTKKVYKMQW